MTDIQLNCSFCGKSQHEVRKLIAGRAAFICNECIDTCNDILLETKVIAALQRALNGGALPFGNKSEPAQP